MRRLDPRLLRHARRARAPLAALVALGAATAGLVIAQAHVLADVTAAAFTGTATPPVLRGALVDLALIVAGRALAAWAREVTAHAASAAVKTELRRLLLTRTVRLGPAWLAARHVGELAELATTGLDTLDGYIAGYLPQLVLAVLVPLAVVAAVTAADPISGVTILATLPLLPLFGALVGSATGAATRRRWRTLAVLAHHFLDVVTGLPTLKVFGRANVQRDTIAKVTDDYRKATMVTLRLAFLSAFVLELAATFAVALVATELGVRLVDRHVSLATGLFVLVLAPEAYLPLRRAGAGFHASADGLAAADQAIAVIETPDQRGNHPSMTARRVPRRVTGVRVENVAVQHDGRSRPTPDGVSLSLTPGRITAVTGPSGCGKSTLIDVLLGFLTPATGGVTVTGPDGEVDLTALTENELERWRARIAWLPQNPVLFPGNVATNIQLSWPQAPAAAVNAAASAAALTEIPLSKRVNDRGEGLSAGQRRRVALARALLPDRQQRPLLLLDEPTAGLDNATEARVLATLRAEADTGRIVLVATHRPAVLAAADIVVSVDGHAYTSRTREPEPVGRAGATACPHAGAPA